MLSELRERDGTTTLELRRRLAAVAFARTAAYESAIARWFQRGGISRDVRAGLRAPLDLRVRGESAAACRLLRRAGSPHLLAFVQQLQGKDLSFNNLNDLSAARLLAHELDRPACVIVKHANPCGVAVAETVEDAYRGPSRRIPSPRTGASSSSTGRSRHRSRRRSRGNSWRSSSRPRTRHERSSCSPPSRPCACSSIASSARRTGTNATTGACSAACWCRSATASRSDARMPTSSAARSGTTRGTTCSSPGASSSTSPRTRSCSPATAGRSESARDNEPRGCRPDRGREGEGARPPARGRRAGLGRVLPVRGWPGARARGRGRGVHPAWRFERDDEVIAAVEAAGAAMAFTNRRHFRH